LRRLSCRSCFVSASTSSHPTRAQLVERILPSTGKMRSARARVADEGPQREAAQGQGREDRGPARDASAPDAGGDPDRMEAPGLERLTGRKPRSEDPIVPSQRGCTAVSTRACAGSTRTWSASAGGHGASTTRVHLDCAGGWHRAVALTAGAGTWELLIPLLTGSGTRGMTGKSWQIGGDSEPIRSTLLGLPPSRVLREGLARPAAVRVRPSPCDSAVHVTTHTS
jgi:hypothetical protein